jgi:hypothetical protein
MSCTDIHGPSLGRIDKTSDTLADQRLPRLIMASLLFIALSLSFTTNIFSVVEDVLYRVHSGDPESLVVGRLLKSESSGITSGTGFLVHNGYATTYPQFRTAERPVSVMDYYLGQVGLQGWVFSAIDIALYKVNVPAISRLQVLRGLAALALAAVLSIWIYFLAAEFGMPAALGAGLMAFYSSWLASFADNLYWVPVTWFIPAVLTWYWTVYRPDLFAASEKRFYLWHGIALASKALCGFEYISAVAGASASVFLYGVLKLGWRRSTITRLLAFLCTSIVAIFLAVVIQVLLLWIRGGSLDAAFHDFFERVQYRSGITEGAPAGLAESLRIPIGQIISIYLNAVHVVNVTGVAQFNSSQVLDYLMWPLAVALVYLAFRDRSLGRVFPLVALIFGSFVASISWHVVARGHSYIHQFFNYVLWFVPLFIILAAVTINVVWEVLFPRVFFPPYRPSVVIVILVLALGWTSYRSFSIADLPQSTSALTPVGDRPAAHQMKLRIADGVIEGSFDCDRVDLLHPFFLRLDPKSGASNSSSDGVSYQFAYREKATSIELNELRYGKCSFKVASLGPFAKISVGQYSGESQAAVEWQQEFQNPR